MQVLVDDALGVDGRETRERLVHRPKREAGPPAVVQARVALPVLTLQEL